MGEPMIDDEDNPYNYYFVPKKEHGYTLSNVNEGDYVLLNGYNNKYQLVTLKRPGNNYGYHGRGIIYVKDITNKGFYDYEIQELWKPLPIGGGESNRKKSVRRRKGTKRRRQGTKRRKGTKRR